MNLPPCLIESRRVWWPARCAGRSIQVAESRRFLRHPTMTWSMRFNRICAFDAISEWFMSADESLVFVLGEEMPDRLHQDNQREDPEDHRQDDDVALFVRIDFFCG